MATTKEMQSRLVELRENLKEMLVATWLHEKKENPQDIAETVRLMAEVVYSLSAEIDLYFQSIDPARNAESGSPAGVGDSAADDEELTDLEPQPDDDETERSPAGPRPFRADGDPPLSRPMVYSRGEVTI